MRRRDAFLSALVPAYALAHHVPYRHRIGRQEGASVEVGHADASRSSRRSIATSRRSSAEKQSAHRTSDLQGGEVQSASIRPHHTDGRLSELFAFAWSGDRLAIGAERASGLLYRGGGSVPDSGHRPGVARLVRCLCRDGLL